MKHFYGIQFKDGMNTTTGEPNKISGRMSIACDIVVFKTRRKRGNWLANERDKTRIPVTLKEIPRYHRGMKTRDLKKEIDSLIFMLED